MSSVTIGTMLLSDLHKRVEETIAEHKSWYFLQALTCVSVGILAMILPAIVADVNFATAVGALLAISGLIKAFAGLKSHIHWWSLMSAALYIVAGGLMLWQPVPGAIALATLVAIFLFAEGLTEIFFGFELESARHWGWLPISGIVSVLLSIILFFGWPGMTTAFLGFMVGLNLLLYGASLLAVSAATPHYETL